jgi:hypothetical protein
MSEIEKVESAVMESASPDVAAKAQEIVDTTNLNFLRESASFAHLQRVAKMFADSSIIPDRFQGKVADCAIGIAMAWRHGADPMMFLNGLYVVHGRPGMEAKLAIALVNSQGVFTGPIQYALEGAGMQRRCRAFAHSSKDGSLCEATVTMEMAKAEGWLAPKKNTTNKWATMPDVMLRYRAATFLIRFYAPDALMGMSTAEELHEIDARTVDSAALAEQREVIKAKIRDVTDSKPALPPSAAEPPLSEVMAAAQVVDQNPPAEKAPPVAQPQEAPPAEAMVEPEAPPTPSADARRQEREALGALYQELSETAGEKPLPLTKLSTAKLKAECERLSAMAKK